MSSESKAKDIFVEALTMHGKVREAFLTSECGDDAELRAEVQRLLAQAEKADTFFGDADGETVMAGEFDGSGSLEKTGDEIGPLRGRAPGTGDDGSPEHCEGA